MLEPLTRFDVDELVRAFYSSRIETRKVTERLFPHSVLIEQDGGGGGDLVLQLFGQRFLYFDRGHIIKDKCFLEARWEWHRHPHFRTAEDAIMFKLAYNP
jgi:hypothetical protein